MPADNTIIGRIKSEKHEMIPIGGKERCKTSLRMAITSQRETTLPRIVVGDGSFATEDGETRGSGVVFEKIG